MPPLSKITYVWNHIEITFSIYCTKSKLEERGLELLKATVTNPLDYKIKH